MNGKSRPKAAPAQPADKPSAPGGVSVTVELIPAALRERRQWVVWQFEERHDRAFRSEREALAALRADVERFVAALVGARRGGGA